MNTIYDEEDEVIDLRELLLFFKKKLWIILIVIVSFAVTGFLVSKLLLTPMYTASTRVYVLSRSNENTIVYSDIQISSQFVNDYQELITGRNVTEMVIAELGLNATNESLRKRIKVTSPTNTRILQIAVKDENPQRAASIANCVREIASEQIQSIMDVDSVRLVYAAEAPKRASSPNVKRNVAISGAFGMILVIAFFAVKYLSDNSIRSEEDVERRLSIGVLGTVPFSKTL